MRKREVILGALFILPVAAAHYFNLEGSLLTTVSALISVGLWVAFITMGSAKIANKFLRTVVSLVLATILAFYFFGQFISYYLQGSYFNAQFFFHMNLSTLTETWQVYNHLVFLFYRLDVLYLGHGFDHSKSTCQKHEIRFCCLGDIGTCHCV